LQPLRFAVVGDPVAHSRSPAMLKAAFEALGVPHTYEAIRASANDLGSLVSALRDGAFAGLNVTVPHKVRVLDFVDARDASATRTGAANTLVRGSDGRVVAHNTDSPAIAGELRLLAGAAARWAPGRGLVLGSGGAARAAVAALGSLGMTDVVVRARGPAWSPGDVPSALVSLWQPWEPSPESEANTLVVVQATSAGMRGASPGDMAAGALDWSALPPGALVLDAVYAPPDTPFLAAARAHGLRGVGGLGMLARQGALALELWLGCTAPLEAMRAALEAPHGS
jgi:shikimate dehydrogenase